jgi:UDP-glucose:(heptosyl)LPS alpha-1,3-glucosyltransferase
MLSVKEWATQKGAVRDFMRVALCHKRMDGKGGTERDFYMTAKGLRDLGHEVHLFCSEFAIPPPSGTFVHPVPVLRFGRTARLWSFALRAPRIIEKFDCDVVVSFGRMIRQDVLRSGGGSHKLFLQRLAKQGGLRRRVWQKLSAYHRSLLAIEERQFGPGGCKQVIAVSEEVKREVMACYGVSEEKIVVLHNGVDLKRFHPSLRSKWRYIIRNEWNIPLDSAVVLLVGSGFRRKGLDRLLRLWGSSQLTNIYLLVVGDDARIGRYKAWAAKEAPGRIIFTGRQENVERFYGAADVVALPSIQEAFGNIILEALASGLPVIVSRSVGAAEVLTGWLAQGIVEDPDEAAEWERKLAYMLERSHRPATAIEARRLSEAYSWENHFRRLEVCLAQVCRQNRGESLS